MELVKQDHKTTGRATETERGNTNMNGVQSSSAQFAVIAMLLVAMIILATISEASALIVTHRTIVRGKALIDAAQMCRSTCLAWNRRFFLRCATEAQEAQNKRRGPPPKTYPNDGKKKCAGCPGAGGKGCKGKCVWEE